MKKILIGLLIVLALILVIRYVKKQRLVKSIKAKGYADDKLKSMSLTDLKKLETVATPPLMAVA